MLYKRLVRLGTAHNVKYLVKCRLHVIEVVVCENGEVRVHVLGARCREVSEVVLRLLRELGVDVEVVSVNDLASDRVELTSTVHCVTTI